MTACPTGALRGDYTIDATRCISDLTQRTDPIPRELRPLIGDWVWGCDLCQDVCPPTQRAGAAAAGVRAARCDEARAPSLAALLRLQAAASSSAVTRARRSAGAARRFCGATRPSRWATRSTAPTCRRSHERCRRSAPAGARPRRLGARAASARRARSPLCRRAFEREARRSACAMKFAPRC